MDPKEIVRKIKAVDIKNFDAENGEVTKTYNPNMIITKMVKEYARYVGNEETANYFSNNGEYPEIHKERAIDRVADMAETEGYNFLEVVHA